MMTNEDMLRLKLPELTPDQIRRISNAEITCQNATTDWSKNYWFNVFRSSSCFLRSFKPLVTYSLSI